MTNFSPQDILIDRADNGYIIHFNFFTEESYKIVVPTIDQVKEEIQIFFTGK